MTFSWAQDGFKPYLLQFTCPDTVAMVTVETPVRTRPVYITAVAVNGESQWIINAEEFDRGRARTVSWKDDRDAYKIFLSFASLTGGDDISITFYGQETVFEKAELNILTRKNERSFTRVHDYWLRRAQ